MKENNRHQDAVQMFSSILNLFLEQLTHFLCNILHHIGTYSLSNWVINGPKWTYQLPLEISRKLSQPLYNRHLTGAL